MPPHSSTGAERGSRPWITSHTKEPITPTRRRLIARARLMSELTLAGEDHRHAALVGGGDHFGVANGTTRLDDRAHARLGRLIDAVAERKECVRSEDGTVGDVIRLVGLVHGDECGID